MNDSRSYITLDFRNTHMPVVVKAKRGDTARTLYISLADGGTPYQIAEGCTATFTAKKPDKTVIHNSCTIEGNMIVYPFTEQTCSAAGRVNAEIRLYGSNGRMLTSASFTLEVSKTVVNPGDIPASESEMNALEALILDTTALKHEIEQKLENGDFVGPPGPAPVRGIDYWTEEDKAEMMGSFKVLTDSEIELLNAMLIEDTLINEPEMVATFSAGQEPEHDSNGNILYYTNVTATITNIDKAFIKKAEVGIVHTNGTITTYDWYDAEITFGDTEHSIAYYQKKPYIELHAGILVRLTYYSLIGGKNELIAEAVYNG